MSKQYKVKDLVYGDVFRTESGDQFLMLSNKTNEKGRRVCAPERYGKFGGGYSEIPENWPVALIRRLYPESGKIKKYPLTPDECFEKKTSCDKCGNEFEELQIEYQVCRECLLKEDK